MFRKRSNRRRLKNLRGVVARTSSGRRQASPGFEWLEARQMLAAASWTGGASGYWDVANNWSTHAVPTSTTAVTISTSGATVTIRPGATASASSVTIGAGAALSLSGTGDPTLPTTNWITNSDFESPVASNGTTSPATWVTWGTAYLSRQYAYTGSQSLVVSGASSGGTEQFAATPGNTYTASVYAMVPAASPLMGSAASYFNLFFFSSSETLIGSYTAPNSLILFTSSSATGGPLAGSVGNQGWNRYYTTAVAPAGTAYVQAQVDIYGGAAGGAVYFDDVELGPGQGPSKLAAGSISNSGTLTVGPTNTVAISGQFTQTSTGTLDVQLGSPPSTGSFGLVNVAGAATLAGTLKADLVDGYAPAATDTFTPIEYASESGSFAAETLPSGSGYGFNAAVTFTNVTLSAAPTTALTATINASTSLHAVTTNLLGINLVYWDPDTGTTQTQQLLTAAGLDMYRFPGGSASDDFHFNASTNLGDANSTTIGQFAQAATAAGGTGLVTIDYGSGSPQEAVAELAYLEGSTTDTTAIGNGIEWNDTTGQWQTVNWQTVGYWASLRAATPLAQNDGLNFLRLAHAAPFSNVKYWEVGNEEYGSWEVDHHGTAGPGGSSTGTAHSPSTYAAFAQQFAAAVIADNKLPQIYIGIDSGDPTGASDGNWTKSVLAAGLADGFVPAFISDHSYMQSPGAESDYTLLNQTVSDSGNLLDWSTRYADYQAVLQQTLGSQASSVQVMATEFNSVYSNPGKQTTSLVNGLFLANSLGSLLNSGYNGGFVWDVRNDWETTNNNSNLLYGWRNGGDYGQLGDPNYTTSAPTTGPYIAYPGYYALQLASKVIRSGGQIVTATSNYTDLDVYAVKESSGDLALLVINTNPAANLTEQFNLTGFQPSGAAQVWQYGEAQDTAQSQSATGASALSSLSTSVSLSGSNFSYSFPAYSMTVIDLSPNLAPTVATPASASPSPVTGTSTVLKVLGADDAGESNLTYTWTTTGTPPAAVSFSVNGSNAAKNTTATFTQAGGASSPYNFLVTITDADGLTTTSSVSVIVNQTLTTITVQPLSGLAADGTEQMAATALDQFGHALLTQPQFTWPATSVGTISSTGLFTPPYTAGSVMIQATSGSVTGSDTVTLPGAAVWNGTSGASWNTVDAWTSTALVSAADSPGLRGVAGDEVVFNSAAGGTVNLGGVSPSPADLTFSGPGGYTVANDSGGTIQIAAGATPATVTVSAGTDTISTPVALGSNVTLLPAAGSQLTISGGISGAGQSLAVGGQGTVVLGGPSSYTGGTTVSGGTLVFATPGALPSTGILTVSNGGWVSLGDASGLASLVAVLAGVAATSLATAPPALASSAIVAPSLIQQSSPNDTQTVPSTATQSVVGNSAAGQQSADFGDAIAVVETPLVRTIASTTTAPVPDSATVPATFPVASLLATTSAGPPVISDAVSEAVALGTAQIATMVPDVVAANLVSATGVPPVMPVSTSSAATDAGLLAWVADAPAQAAPAAAGHWSPGTGVQRDMLRPGFRHRVVAARPAPSPIAITVNMGFLG